MIRILRKFIKEIRARLAERKIELHMSKKAYILLARKAYSKEFGAREARRIVERYITEPITDMLVRGQIQTGRTVRVKYASPGLEYEVVE